MVQIFNRSANTLARASILGIALFPLGVGIVQNQLRPTHNVTNPCIAADQPVHVQTGQNISQGNVGTEKLVFWAFLSLCGLAAVLEILMIVLLFLHGFRARTGFSLPQPVLIEVAKTVIKIIVGLIALLISWHGPFSVN